MDLKRLQVALNSDEPDVVQQGLELFVDTILREHHAVEIFGYNGRPLDLRRMGRYVAPSEPQGLLAQYIHASPQLEELFILWDLEGRDMVKSLAATHTRAFAAIIHCLKSTNTRLGLQLCRRILRDKNRSLTNQLTSDHTPLVHATLGLILCMCRFSDQINRETFQRLHPSSKAFTQLATQKKGIKWTIPNANPNPNPDPTPNDDPNPNPNPNPNARTLYVDSRTLLCLCVLTYLEAKDFTITSQLLAERSIFLLVLDSIVRDTTSLGALIPLVLDSIRKHIFEWPGLPSKAKHEFFDEIVLGKLVRWYSSNNPRISTRFHDFVMTLLRDETGVLNPSKTWWDSSTDPRRTNIGKLLHELSPHTNLQQRQVVVYVLDRNPGLLPMCLACFPFNWGSQGLGLGFSALNALTYISHLLLNSPVAESVLERIRAVENFSPKSDVTPDRKAGNDVDSTNADAKDVLMEVISSLFPKGLGKKELTKMILQPNIMLQKTVLTFVAAVLMRTKKLVRLSFPKHISSPGLRALMSSVLVCFIPDIQSLLGLRSQILKLNLDTQQNEPEAQDVEPVTDVDEAADEAKVTVAAETDGAMSKQQLLYLQLLRVCELYLELVPSCAQSSFDALKLIDDCVAWNENQSEAEASASWSQVLLCVPPIQLSAVNILRLYSEEVSGRFLWLGTADDTRKTILKLLVTQDAWTTTSRRTPFAKLLLLAACSCEAQVREQARTVILRVLQETELFNGPNDVELQAEMYHWLHVGSTRTSTNGILVLELLCKISFHCNLWVCKHTYNALVKQDQETQVYAPFSPLVSCAVLLVCMCLPEDQLPKYVRDRLDSATNDATFQHYRMGVIADIEAQLFEVLPLLSSLSRSPQDTRESLLALWRHTTQHSRKCTYTDHTSPFRVLLSSLHGQGEYVPLSFEPLSTRELSSMREDLRGFLDSSQAALKAVSDRDINNVFQLAITPSQRLQKALQCTAEEASQIVTSIIRFASPVLICNGQLDRLAEMKDFDIVGQQLDIHALELLLIGAAFPAAMPNPNPNCNPPQLTTLTKFVHCYCNRMTDILAFTPQVDISLVHTSLRIMACWEALACNLNADFRLSQRESSSIPKRRKLSRDPEQELVLAPLINHACAMCAEFITQLLRRAKKTPSIILLILKSVLERPILRESIFKADRFGRLCTYLVTCVVHQIQLNNNLSSMAITAEMRQVLDPYVILFMTKWRDQGSSVSNTEYGSLCVPVFIVCMRRDDAWRAVIEKLQNEDTESERLSLLSLLASNTSQSGQDQKLALTKEISTYLLEHHFRGLCAYLWALQRGRIEAIKFLQAVFGDAMSMANAYTHRTLLDIDAVRQLRLVCVSILGSGWWMTANKDAPVVVEMLLHSPLLASVCDRGPRNIELMAQAVCSASLPLNLHSDLTPTLTQTSTVYQLTDAVWETIIFDRARVSLLNVGSVASFLGVLPNLLVTHPSLCACRHSIGATITYLITSTNALAAARKHHKASEWKTLMSACMDLGLQVSQRILKNVNTKGEKNTNEESKYSCAAVLAVLSTIIESSFIPDADRAQQMNKSMNGVIKSALKSAFTETSACTLVQLLLRKLYPFAWESEKLRDEVGAFSPERGLITSSHLHSLLINHSKFDDVIARREICEKEATLALLLDIIHVTYANPYPSANPERNLDPVEVQRVQVQLWATYGGTMSMADRLTCRCLCAYNLYGFKTPVSHIRVGANPEISQSQTSLNTSLLKDNSEWFWSMFEVQKVYHTLNTFPLERSIFPQPLYCEPPHAHIAYSNLGLELGLEEHEDGDANQELSEEIGPEGNELEDDETPRSSPEPKPHDEEEDDPADDEQSNIGSPEEPDLDEDDEMSSSQADVLREDVSVRIDWMTFFSERIYDPAFVLPVLDHVLRSSEVSARRCVHSGVLSLVFACMSCGCVHTRTCAYAILQQIEGLLLAQTREMDMAFRERPQLVLLMHFVKNSIVSSDQSTFSPRLPYSSAMFCARAALILTNPTQELYGQVNKYLLSKPHLDIKDIPLFSSMFLSPDTTQSANHTLAAVRMARDSLRLHADHLNLCRKNAYTSLMMMYENLCTDGATLQAILDVLTVALTLPASARYLLQRCGLLDWTREHIHPHIHEEVHTNTHAYMHTHTGTRLAPRVCMCMRTALRAALLLGDQYVIEQSATTCSEALVSSLSSDILSDLTPEYLCQVVGCMMDIVVIKHLYPTALVFGFTMRHMLEIMKAIRETHAHPNTYMQTLTLGLVTPTLVDLQHVQSLEMTCEMLELLTESLSVVISNTPLARVTNPNPNPNPPNPNPNPNTPNPNSNLNPYISPSHIAYGDITAFQHDDECVYEIAYSHTGLEQPSAEKELGLEFGLSFKLFGAQQSLYPANAHTNTHTHTYIHPDARLCHTLTQEDIMLLSWDNLRRLTLTLSVAEPPAAHLGLYGCLFGASKAETALLRRIRFLSRNDQAAENELVAKTLATVLVRIRVVAHTSVCGDLHRVRHLGTDDIRLVQSSYTQTYECWARCRRRSLEALANPNSNPNPNPNSDICALGVLALCDVLTCVCAWLLELRIPNTNPNPSPNPSNFTTPKRRKIQVRQAKEEVTCSLRDLLLKYPNMKAQWMGSCTQTHITTWDSWHICFEYAELLLGSWIVCEALQGEDSFQHTEEMASRVQDTLQVFLKKYGNVRPAESLNEIVEACLND